MENYPRSIQTGAMRKTTKLILRESKAHRIKIGTTYTRHTFIHCLVYQNAALALRCARNVLYNVDE